LGGGRTVSKLAAIATQGKVYAVDYSDESVAATKRTNVRWMDLGRVEIRRGSVSQLPFPTACSISSRPWKPILRPNLPGDCAKVFSEARWHAHFIAEIYKGAKTMAASSPKNTASRTGMTLLSVDEHRELFTKTPVTRMFR